MLAPTNLTRINGLFESSQIRILGTMYEPIFVAADVASAIKDENYWRILDKYSPEYAYTSKIKNAKKQVRDMWVLTENGLYKYLLSSPLPKAESFQLWVFDMLKTLRVDGKVVLDKKINELTLSTKIATDQKNIANKKYYHAVMQFKYKYQRKLFDTHITYLTWCVNRYNDYVFAVRPDNKLIISDIITDKELVSIAEEAFDNEEYDIGYENLYEFFADLA